MTLKTVNAYVQDINEETHYILIDLRDKEDYHNFHIIDAINVPAALINRGNFPSIMYEFKNIPNKLIIFYHDDEKSGLHVINNVAERGFDNIFYLTFEV